jgi:hypothetical protein
MAGILQKKVPSYFNQTPKITTEEIGQKLDEQYPHPNSDNVPIDYFYLQIRKRWVYKKKEISARGEILKALLDHSLEFFKVNPGLEWPSIFFFHFPRDPQHTMRQQEENLNQIVRWPLKRTLEEKFQEFKNPEKPDTNPSVHIMITRVCKYTGPDDGFMEAFDDEDSWEEQ